MADVELLSVWAMAAARAVGLNVFAFFLSRSSCRVDFRFVSRTRLASLSAKVVDGFGGDWVGDFQEDFSETWLAFLPRSMPSATRSGEAGLLPMLVE